MARITAPVSSTSGDRKSRYQQSSRIVEMTGEHVAAASMGKKRVHRARVEVEEGDEHTEDAMQARTAGSSLSRCRAVMTTASSSGSLVLSSPSTSSPYHSTSLPLLSRYNPLVTFSVAMLVLSMVNPAWASLSCETDADCSIKGKGHCKQQSNGEATCMYTSCAAGFWGAGNTYTDCFECPAEMTSLEGRAFYSTDCFVPCGDSRCFMPEDGYTECSIDAATATQGCYSSCNRDGFVVANPDRPYAVCVPDHQFNTSETSSSSNSYTSSEHAIINQALPKVGAYADHEVNPKAKERRRQRQVRMLKRNVGRRLRKAADLRSGPAVAFLEHAGEDPWALVSK